MEEDGEQHDFMHVITTQMLCLGFQANTRGYRYLRDAVMKQLCRRNTPSVTKQLYPTLAELHGTTDKQVERAIRAAIETAWEQGDQQLWTSQLAEIGHTQGERPTNREVIDILVNMTKRSDHA